MLVLRLLVVVVWSAGVLLAQTRPATFGTIVGPVSQGGVNYLIGGATDLVLGSPGKRPIVVSYATSPAAASTW